MAMTSQPLFDIKTYYKVYKQVLVIYTVKNIPNVLKLTKKLHLIIMSGTNITQPWIKQSSWFIVHLYYLAEQKQITFLT